MVLMFCCNKPISSLIMMHSPCPKGSRPGPSSRSFQDFRDPNGHTERAPHHRSHHRPQRVDQYEEMLDSRREQRKAIAFEGCPKVWGASPEHNLKFWYVGVHCCCGIAGAPPVVAAPFGQEVYVSTVNCETCLL